MIVVSTEKILFLFSFRRSRGGGSEGGKKLREKESFPPLLLLLHLIAGGEGMWKRFLLRLSYIIHQTNLFFNKQKVHS